MVEPVGNNAKAAFGITLPAIIVPILWASVFTFRASIKDLVNGDEENRWSVGQVIAIGATIGISLELIYGFQFQVLKK